MKKIINFFRNMKFRYKLVVTYILLGVFPIIIMGLVWYNQSRTLLIIQDENNMKNYLFQAISNMDNQLRIYDNLSNYVAFNQQISHVVKNDYESYYDMYNDFYNILDPMLSSLKYFHSDIDEITIYTYKDIVKHNTVLGPISDIESTDWYPKVKDDNKIHWFILQNEKTVFSARSIPELETKSEVGVLYIKVDYEKLFESFKQMNESNYGIFILDENGKEIFEFSKFEKNNESMGMTVEEFKEESKNQKSYSIVQFNATNENWTISLYKPKNLISKSINNMIFGTIIAIFLFIIFSLIVTSILSKLMVNGLEKLRENMEQIENGNMEIIVESDSKDEIGTLIRGFGKMIIQIKTLIEDVYESKIIQKDYEMKALQAQINPHFLYNTLSLINWMALEVEQDEISKITLSLSTFYRTALNKGKNILLVRDEIKNMESYLDIQLMMHDYEFDVDIEIDKEILDYQILNLLLQPLIENAIDHGIDLKIEERGCIKILGQKENDEIIISVTDNGIGMEQDKVDIILTSQSKGYGIKNVNERIQLYYGEKYGLNIQSQVGIGTKITFRIPIKSQ